MNEENKSASQPKTIKYANKILSSKNPVECCIEAGINLVEIYERLNYIATRAKVYDKYGDEIGDDYSASLKAIELILELNKHLKVKDVNDGGIRPLVIINPTESEQREYQAGRRETKEVKTISTSLRFQSETISRHVQQLGNGENNVVDIQSDAVQRIDTE